MFAMDFTVRHSYLGADGFMRPSLLLSAIQDAATEDAERDMHMGRRAMLERFGAFWIISRTSLYIDRPLVPEECRIITWRCVGRGALWPRATVIVDASGEIAVRCISQWSAISFEEPRRIVPLTGITCDSAPYEMPPSRRPRVPADAPLIGTHAVVRSDLDENRHVNNARALDILEDAAAQPGQVLREAHIHYAGEAHSGDILTLHGVREESRVLLRTVREDGKSVHEAELVY